MMRLWALIAFSGFTLAADRNTIITDPATSLGWLRA
jgi:hypothetical protein